VFQTRASQGGLKRAPTEDTRAAIARAGPDSAKSLEGSDDFADRRRLLGEHEDAVDVVGHDDELVESQAVIPARKIVPDGFDLMPEVVLRMMPSVTSPNRHSRPNVQMVTKYALGCA
jgi:hypothetical protein